MRARWRLQLALATASGLLAATVATAGGAWKAADVRALPDAAFAVVTVRPDGTRARRLPHHDREGRVDPAHLRSALARLSQVGGLSPDDVARARRHLRDHARELGWRVPP
jgi:hypothetical protein